MIKGFEIKSDLLTGGRIGKRDVAANRKSETNNLVGKNSGSYKIVGMSRSIPEIVIWDILCWGLYELPSLLEGANPNPDLELDTLLPVSHCEHLQGACLHAEVPRFGTQAWQSLGEGRDCFVSLATTISKSGFGAKRRVSFVYAMRVTTGRPSD